MPAKHSATEASLVAHAMTSAKNRVWDDARLMGAAVVVLAALAYVNALGNGLVWDDPIVLTRQLLAFQSVRDLIFLPRNIPQFSPDYYRPLTVASYLIDRAVAGSSPFMFHFSVVLWHVVATYLVFRLGLVLFQSSSVPAPAAGLAAALFAVHPIHTESVAWGAGRSDVLACAFVLAAAMVYLSKTVQSPTSKVHRQVQSPKSKVQSGSTEAGGSKQGLTIWRAAGAAVLVLAGALAKETAVVFFVLLPFSDLLFKRPAAPIAPPVRRSERRRASATAAPAAPQWLAWLPFAAAMALYLVLRRASLGGVLGEAGEGSRDVASRLLGAVGLYIAKLVLPLRQCAYISDLPAAPLTLIGIGVLLLGLVAAGLLYLWQRGERTQFFLLLWIAASLAPSLAIVIKIPAAPVAERYLYIPSVGYCLLLGYGIIRALARMNTPVVRAAVLAGIAVVLVAATAATRQRNGVWRSNLTLWEDTAAKNLSNGLPMRSLAAAYQQRGEAARAAAHFQQALQRHNDTAGLVTIYNNLGSLAMVAKNLDEAERNYRAALARQPQMPDALFNLALISLTRAKEDGSHDEKWKQDEARKARQVLDQAQRLSPLDPDIPLALGETLRILGETGGARAQYERALQLGLPAVNEKAVRAVLAELP